MIAFSTTSLSSSTALPATSRSFPPVAVPQQYLAFSSASVMPVWQSSVFVQKLPTSLFVSELAGGFGWSPPGPGGVGGALDEKQTKSVPEYKNEIYVVPSAPSI